MHYKYWILNIGLLLWLASCNTEDELIEERERDNPPADTTLRGTTSSLDFSNYVAIGNSLTAGLMDAALYTDGQNNSFPNILAQHLQRVEGIEIGDFNQPDIDAVNGFNTSLNDPATFAQAPPTGRFILDTSIPGPVPTTPGQAIDPYTGDKAALNNFGVPGMRLIEVAAPRYGRANPFFGRFARDPEASSVLGDALATNPTFFTLWLGSNDALSWAIQGGAPPDGEDSVAAQMTDPNTLTSIASFAQAYQGAVQALTANGAEGVAITIPPLTLLPFFRLVSYNAVPLDEATATALNAGYTDYNNGLGAAVQLGLIDNDELALRTISFAAGANAVVMLDEGLDSLDISAAVGAPAGSVVLPNIRQTNPSDLLPLTIASELGQPVISENDTTIFGLSSPAGDAFVLTLNEQTTLLTRVATFNGIIAQIVASSQGQVALFDINPLFADIAGLNPTQAGQLGLGPASVAAADGQPGLTVDGLVLQPDFSPNGIISTDGIHPNPRGHAIVANGIVNTINQSFEGTTIPNIDTSPYRTVILAQ